MNDGTADLKLDTIFPQTEEEARASDDNLITFSISGINTTLDKNLYYEIKLIEGSEVEGKTRFNPEHLKFDLYEVIDGVDVKIVDAMSFNSLNETRIWVNTIYSETNNDVSKTYKLRMWLSDDVIISDTLLDADYTTEEFRNSYASVRVAVSGDFNEKKTPYNYMIRSGETFTLENGGNFWPEDIQSAASEITEVRFMSMDQSLIDMLIEGGAYDLTDTTKSEAGSIVAFPMDTTLMIMSEGITFFPEDCSGMFAGFQKMTNIYFNNVNTRYVTNMLGMFGTCQSLLSLDLNNFDTKNVSDMSNMFYYCFALTSLNISSWDVSNVETMSNMFYNCVYLKDLLIGSLNMKNVKDMSYMFYYCTSLVNLDVSDWNTENVTDMRNMFQWCRNLQNLDVSNWNTDKVTNMSYMFYYCVSLEKLNVNGWNVSSVTDMSYMFTGIGVETLDVRNWDVSNVTTMALMFGHCSNLTTIYSNTNWQTIATKLVNSGSMFNASNKLVGAVPYNGNSQDISMANPDTGYFTRKG